METTLTPMEEAIKSMLDNFIKQDPDPNFIEKYNNPKKSIAECCKYILGEIEKQLPSKSGKQGYGCPDEVVLGMAIHYYDEDDIVVEGPTAKVVVQPTVTQKTDASETKPKTRKPRTKKVEVTEVIDENIPEPFDIPLF